jgi:hypothetical protein
MKLIRPHLHLRNVLIELPEVDLLLKPTSPLVISSLFKYVHITRKCQFRQADLQLINFTGRPPCHFRKNEPRNSNSYSTRAREALFESYQHCLSVQSTSTNGGGDEWNMRLTKIQS